MVHNSPIDARYELLKEEKLRPSHWIEPKLLAACYWARLRNHEDVLTDFYRSVWPGPSEDDTVDLVNDALSRVIEAVNSQGDMSLAEFLYTSPIAEEQAHVASEVISKRLGRNARLTDIFDAYDRKADILKTRQDYEPGAVAYGNLLHQTDQWFEFFNALNQRVRPDQADLDLREAFDVEIVQDEPAVCRDVDYQAVYKRVAKLARDMGMATWAKEPTFRRSHETPGLIAADVWAAVLKAMWEGVQNGNTADWDDIAGEVMQLGWHFTDFVAPLTAQEAWNHFEGNWLSKSIPKG